MKKSEKVGKSCINFWAMSIFLLFLFSIISGLYFGAYIFGYNDGSTGFCFFIASIVMTLMLISRGDIIG